MSTLEQDLKLGDLEMGEHTDRLGMAMPYTLVLFALAAFSAAVVYIVYASMAGQKINDLVDLTEKLIHGHSDDPDVHALTEDEEKAYKHQLRSQWAYQGAVLGFLMIISYAVVYGALKLAHHHK